MASLKDKKLFPTLFLLSGQDADVTTVVMGAEGGVAWPLCPARVARAAPAGVNRAL